MEDVGVQKEATDNVGKHNREAGTCTQSHPNLWIKNMYTFFRFNMQIFG